MQRIYGYYLDHEKAELVLYHGDGEEIRHPIDYLMRGITSNVDKNVPAGSVKYVFKSGVEHVCEQKDSLLDGGRMFIEPLPPTALERAAARKAAKK